MRMDRQRQAGGQAGAGDDLEERRAGKRLSSLGREHVGRLRPGLDELVQLPDLRRSHRVDIRQPVLDSGYVHNSRCGVDLVSPQAHQFGHPEPMPVCRLNHECIPCPVAAELRRRRHELLHLRRVEVCTPPGYTPFGLSGWSGWFRRLDLPGSHRGTFPKIVLGTFGLRALYRRFSTKAPRTFPNMVVLGNVFPGLRGGPPGGPSSPRRLSGGTEPSRLSIVRKGKGPLRPGPCFRAGPTDRPRAGVDRGLDQSARYRPPLQPGRPAVAGARRNRGRKPRHVTPALGDSVEILATSETMLAGLNGLFGRVRALIQLDAGR